MTGSTVNQLSLAPLGAGDLIDRAIRLYRNHFFTLIRISSPPVIVAAIGSVVVSVCWRQIATTSDDLTWILFALLIVFGAVLIAAGNVFSLVVMGGAARNLVTHLLWNEPVSVRTTYAAVRSRFWGLLIATVIVLFWIAISASVALVGWYLVSIVVFSVAFMLGQFVATWLGVVVGAIGIIITLTLALWLLFFLAGRVAYVPQAMLVEGKGVLEAVGRSFSLASGNVRRLMAMTLFSTFAFYSALMILVVPLGWYGYVSGVDLSPFNQYEWPAWYVVGYNVIWEASHILLAPVWMLGLSLLYVDERVRHEGYDIELMAARQLSEMPQLDVTSPLAPAISLGRKKTPPPPMASGSVLGLR